LDFSRPSPVAELETLEDVDARTVFPQGMCVRTGPIRRVLSGVSDDEQRSGETHARTNHKSS
jgi:hypothetical protein